MLTPVCALPLTAAALPPAAIDEPVRPVAEVDVPPVPTVEADVPPAAAEPPLPPVILVCARTGEAAASKTATAEVVSNVLMFQSSMDQGDEVEIVQPLTVMVLALVEPGPPAVDDELETLPPPACTCTDDPPAELELESEPLDEVDPVVPEPDEPSAVMLPSACFSTVTLQVSPDAVLPVFSMVAA
ncbi:hypothetical protein JJB98_05560 [Bradyrhizobium diazoefficiens]|nr:hypothetical protein JJB98_05560 [Bradyrhizobium diazoefficiens]